MQTCFVLIFVIYLFVIGWRPPTTTWQYSSLLYWVVSRTEHLFWLAERMDRVTSFFSFKQPPETWSSVRAIKHQLSDKIWFQMEIRNKDINKYILKNNIREMVMDNEISFADTLMEILFQSEQDCYIRAMRWVLFQAYVVRKGWLQHDHPEYSPKHWNCLWMNLNTLLQLTARTIKALRSIRLSNIPIYIFCSSRSKKTKQ